MSASGLSALFLPFVCCDISHDGAQFNFNIYIVNFKIAKWSSICWRCGWRWRCHHRSSISQRSHSVAGLYFCFSEDLWSGKRDCSAARLWYGLPLAICWSAGLLFSLYLPSVWILWCSRCRQPDRRALTIGHVNRVCAVCTRFQWYSRSLLLLYLRSDRLPLLRLALRSASATPSAEWTPVEASHFSFCLKKKKTWWLPREMCLSHCGWFTHCFCPFPRIDCWWMVSPWQSRVYPR